MQMMEKCGTEMQNDGNVWGAESSESRFEIASILGPQWLWRFSCHLARLDAKL